MAAVGTRTRARRGSLDRSHIVDAAERLVRGGEHGALSMRALAADLGVAPMSLYGHVRDKDDLLEEVVDRLLASCWEPAAPRSDGLRWVGDAAARLRELLITEPAALHVYLAHPVSSPAAIERMEAMLEVLCATGLSEEEAEAAYAAVHTYTVGFAALEASRNRGFAPEGATPDPLRHRLARFTTSAQFREGLSYLLAGAIRAA